MFKQCKVPPRGEDRYLMMGSVVCRTRGGDRGSGSDSTYGVPFLDSTAVGSLAKMQFLLRKNITMEMKKSTENECRPNFESEFKFLKNMRTLLTLKSIDRLIYRRRNKYL